MYKYNSLTNFKSKKSSDSWWADRFYWDLWAASREMEEEMLKPQPDTMNSQSFSFHSNLQIGDAFTSYIMTHCSPDIKIDELLSEVKSICNYIVEEFVSFGQF